MLGPLLLGRAAPLLLLLLCLHLLRPAGEGGAPQGLHVVRPNRGTSSTVTSGRIRWNLSG
ncbi:hypothetical protein [Streptomyces sp. NBC_00354]|uniref:hypothetical protein n=1 Tax=Streptomyces sp. NBC_00354 TaxID=2975723 RepID=UPI002E2650DE